MSVVCRPAQPQDDSELRRILRKNPFPGAISLSFEREPNYFTASAIEGPFHQTLAVCEPKTGRLMGMGNRSVRPLWVNGQVREIGYFSGLRADAPYRRGLALARFVQQGFAAYAQWHCDGRTPFYLISVVDNNLPAQRLLTAGLKSLPSLRKYTRMVTHAIHPARPKSSLPLPSGLQLVRGAPEHIPAIVDCLQRNGSRQQFSPYWTEETLLSPLTPYLAIDDFFLALNGSRVVGCLALWDQQPCKQTVVRGYSGGFKRWRKAINLLAPLGGWPPLPEVGTPLNQCFIAFPAVDNDDPQIFAALLRAAYNEAARRRYSYLLIGLPEAHPLRRVLTGYRPLEYVSQVYLAAWQDGQDEIDNVDTRLPGLEIAIL